MSIQWNNEDYLAHYGVPRRSGRYKWGSGKDPYHHGASLPSGKKKTIKKEYKERKKENKEAYKSIKKGLNKEYTTKSRRILREEVSLDNKLYAAKNKYQEANKKYDDAYEKAYLHDTIHGRPITGRDRRAQIDNWSAVRKEQENRLNAKKQFRDDATSITAKKKVLDKQFEDLADKHMADRRAAYKDYRGAKKDLKNNLKEATNRSKTEAQNARDTRKNNIKQGRELLKSKSRLERKELLSKARAEVQRNAANDKNNPFRSLNRVNEKYYNKKAEKYGAKIDAKNESLKKKINRNNTYANMQARAAQNPNNPLRAVNGLNEKHYRKKVSRYNKKVLKHGERVATDIIRKSM